jgi:tyrosyl-tRNA synthetase
MRRSRELQDAMAVIERGTVEIFPRPDLEDKLAHSIAKAEPLRVKFGMDPTAPDIHLGHSVPLRKLRDFQDLGHTAVLVVGDFTGLVGDPSGRSKTRPQLSPDEIEQNAETYLDQAAAILDPERLKVVRNGDWFGAMAFRDVLDLASKMTVARMLERDDFSKRYAEGSPISIHEFLYCLMQGYDSVQVRSDVELGGTDQRFNLLVGRQLQRDAGQEPQVAITMPMLVGTDGTEKMSKSLGNYVGITEPPAEMYGKIMSLPDPAMRDYFTLLTKVPADEIERLLGPDSHPRDAKRRLAREIVGFYGGADAAAEAEAEFDKVFVRSELPSEIPDYTPPRADLKDGKIWIARLVKGAGLADSTTEARRLIGQGAVSIDDTRIDDPEADVPVVDGMVLRVGKRRFARVKM